LIHGFKALKAFKGFEGWVVEQEGVELRKNAQITNILLHKEFTFQKIWQKNSRSNFKNSEPFIK
jgi:hypothetical protein